MRAIASRTFSSVDAGIWSGELTARDTVIAETPATRATSLTVAGLRLGETRDPAGRLERDMRAILMMLRRPERMVVEPRCPPSVLIRGKSETRKRAVEGERGRGVSSCAVEAWLSTAARGAQAHRRGVTGSALGKVAPFQSGKNGLRGRHCDAKRPVAPRSAKFDSAHVHQTEERRLRLGPWFFI